MSNSNSKKNGLNHKEDKKALLMLSQKIINVFKVFDETFSRFKLKEVFLSFNGGKDCTVLLDLLKRYLHQQSNSLKDASIRVIYIQPAEPFAEVEDFVEECKGHYNIEIPFQTGNLKRVLEQYCADHQELKAVFIGCRRTDPHCENLKVFQQSDPDWPPLLRINPLLDWTYKDIWDYIQVNHTPYCRLYDEGYTSLGNKTNTKKNPHLRVEGSTCAFKPAYELQDGSLERAGRV